jgi:hypothetical protein
MWRNIKAIPTEVAGSAVFSFLSPRDVVQVERALVNDQERVILFDMVRAGPALDIHYRAPYQWMRKNKLIVKNAWVRAIDCTVCEEMHSHVESVCLHVDENILELMKHPKLCDKVSMLWVDHGVPIFASDAAPGKHIRKLKTLWANAVHCTEPWILELMEANSALHMLELDVNPEHPLAPGWFEQIAKRCVRLQELKLWVLRVGLDDDVLWRISEHFPALRKLRINCASTADQSSLPEAPVVAIALRCKQLEDVYLSAPALTAAIVTAFCVNCRNITALKVPDSPLSLADLQHLLPQHRKHPITELEGDWALQQESEVLACAALFSGLTILKVTVPAQCRRAFSTACAHLGGLHELYFNTLGSTVAAVEECLFAVAQHCRLLRQLELGKDAQTGGHAVAAVAERNRYLHSFDWQYDADGRSGDTALCALGCHCPLIDKVIISGVSNEGVRAIAEGCKHLDYLLISRSAVTDDALVALALHSKVITRVLLLGCPGVTERGLTALVASRRSLCFLRVNHPNIEAASAVRIAGSNTKCSVYIR